MPDHPVIVGVAPNGARKGKNDHARLPLTPDELARCAAGCVAAGASLFHLHVRDLQGRHSLEAQDYRAAIDAIRSRVGSELIIQVTTESGGRYTPAQQIDCAEAVAPEALSLAVRELFGDAAGRDKAPSFLADLARRRTLVQYIVYTVRDIEHCLRLHADGVIPQRRPQLLLVLGSYAERRWAGPRELLPMLTALPSRWPWSVCAFGPRELACVTAGALLGGHVRVGFENSLQLASGASAADNADLVKEAVTALTGLGLRPATCTEARALFARDV